MKTQMTFYVYLRKNDIQRENHKKQLQQFKQTISMKIHEIKPKTAHFKLGPI